MKSIRDQVCQHLFLSLILSCTVIFAPAAQATSAIWNGSNSGTWSTSGNWDGSPATVPGTGDTATFTYNTGSATISLGTGLIINQIVFDGTPQSYTIGAGVANSQTFTLDNAGAILMNASVANIQTFNSAILLGNTGTTAAYTFSNASTLSDLIFNGNITGGSGGTGGTKTLNVGGAGNITISGAVTKGGASALTFAKTGTGTVTLNNSADTFTTLNMGGGILNLAADITLNNSGNRVLDGTGGIINTSGGKINLAGGAAGNYGDWQASAGLTINATITGSVGIDFYNSGSITLTAQNTFTGSVDLFGTKLYVSNLGTTGSASSNIGTSGTIVFANSTTGGMLVYTGLSNETTDKTVDLHGTTGGATIDQSGTGLLKFTSDMTGSSYHNNTLTLQGSTAGSGEFAGAISNLSSGSANINGTFTSGSGTMAVASTTGLTIGAGVTRAGSITSGTTITAIGTGTITLSSPTIGAGSNTAVTFSGGIVSLTKTGTGMWTLSGANSYTGTTTISGGTLQYTGSGGNSGNGAYTVITGGKLLLNTSGEVKAGTFTFSGNTAGTAVTLQSGLLTVGAGGITSGGVNNALNFAGGTLKSSAPFSISSNLPINLNTGGGTIDTTGGNITSSSAFLIGTGGGLTVQGGNTLTLPSSNTVSGGMTITGNSTVKLLASTMTSVVTVNGGSTFDLNNASSSIGGLAGGGTVLNSGATALRTLTITGAGGNIFSGTINPVNSASISVTVSLTSGAQTFSGANTYTGGTTINNGVLFLNHTGDANPAIAGNATITGNGTGPLRGTLMLQADGQLAPTAAVYMNTTGTSYADFVLGGHSATIAFFSATATTGTEYIENAKTDTQGVITSPGTLTFNNSSDITLGSTVYIRDKEGGTSSGGLVIIKDGAAALNAGTGTIANTGGWILKNGTLKISGNNFTATTPMTLQGGTISSDSTTGRTIASPVTLAGAVTLGDAVNTGSLTFSSAGTLTGNRQLTVNSLVTYSGVIGDGGGTFGFTKLGTGTLTLKGANTYTGNTILGAGVLNVGTTTALGSGTLVFSGASTLQAGANITIANKMSINSGVAATVDTAGFTPTLSGIIGGAGSLSKIGTTALTLGGVANTFTGGLFIKQGTVNSGNNNNSLGANGNTITIGDTTLGQNSTLNIGNGARTYQNPITIASGAGNRVISSSYTTGGATTLTGAVSMNNNLTITAGSGIGTTFIFSGGFTGSGNLFLGVAGNTAGITLQTGAVNNTGSILNYGAGTAGSTITSVVGANVTGINQNSSTSALTLSGNNTSFAGGATITSGTLQVKTSDKALGTGSLTFAGSGTLQAGDSRTIGNSVTIASGVTATMDTGANTLTLTSSVDGAGALSKKGSGTLRLSVVNAYGGGTSINAGSGVSVGTVVAAANNALGTGKATVAFNTGAGSAQLQLTGGISLANDFDTTGVGTGSSGVIRNISGNNELSGVISLVGGGGYSTYQADVGTQLTLSGTIGADYTVVRGLTLQGAGDFLITGKIIDQTRSTAGSAFSLIVAGSAGGMTTLSNPLNSFSQGTTINAGGILKLGASEVIPNGANKGDLIVNGTLNLGGFSETVNGLSGSGTIDNNTGTGAYTLTAGDNNQTSTYDGIIKNTSGTLALSKVGTGSWTLTGNNTYTGATLINGGTLALSGSGSIVNSVLIDVVASATFDVSGVSGYTLGNGQTLQGNGTVVGPVTASGTVAPGNGVGTLTFSSDFTLANNGTLSLELSGNNMDQIVVGGNLTLTGTINFAATGTQTSPAYVFATYGGTLNHAGVTVTGLPSGYTVNWAYAANEAAIVIPEPSALLLVGVGLVGLMLTSRWFRRRNA